MGKSTKVHFYDHTLRTATMINGFLCNQAMFFYPVPPKEALTVENLQLHFKMTLDTTGLLAPGDRILKWVGIASARPAWYLDPIPGLRKLDLNLVADPVTRVIEKRIDLTPLLNKKNVGYREYFADPVGENFTYIVFMLGDKFQEVSAAGIMDLCKTDTLYTTTGIR